MAELTIDYDNLQGIIDSANTLAVKAESYYESLQNNVINSFGGVTAGVNDVLESAQYYVTAKKQQLVDKANEYATFAKNVGVLMAHAKQADLDVATKIENNQEDFLKNHSEIKAAEGIEAFLLNLFVEAKNACPLFEIVADIYVYAFDQLTDFCQAMKYFYRCGGGKEIVEIIGAVIMVGISIAILVAAFPLSAFALTFEFVASLATAIGAAIGVVNAFANLMESKNALSSVNNGDPAWGKIYSDTDKVTDVLRLKNYNSKYGNMLSYVAADFIEYTDTLCTAISFLSAGDKILQMGDGKGVKKVFDSAKKSLTWDYKTTSGSLSGLLKNGVEWETRRKYLKDFANCVKYGTADAGILIDAFFGLADSNDIKDELIVKKFFRMNAANGLIDKGSKSLGAIDGFFAHSYTNQLREYYCCNTVTEMVIKEGIMKWID